MAPISGYACMDDSLETKPQCDYSLVTPHEGMCPTGWHVAGKAEWSGLFQTTMNPGSGDSTYNLRGIDTAWHFEYNPPYTYYPGSGKYGDFLVPTGYVTAFSEEKASTAASFWLPTQTQAFPFPGFIGMYDQTVFEGYEGVTPDRASLRCVLNPP
jgi:uncharacterized protein (TIGR02145 family)